MKMTSKYIVYLYKNQEIIIIFPELLQHSDMANSLKVSIKDIISAGFIRLNSDKELCCYGESISLDKESRHEIDSKIASFYL